MQTAVIFAQTREGKEARKRSLGDTGCRDLGRLGGDRNNPSTLGEACLLAVPKTPLGASPYATTLEAGPFGEKRYSRT